MMKKALILTSALTLSIIAGCSNQDEGTKNGSNSANKEATTENTNEKKRRIIKFISKIMKQN